MKKLIKIDFDNTTRERKTEDSFSELYSYDKNNGSFEFEILNDTLTSEQVTALFKFTESNKIWKTTGTVEGNKVNVTFDTSLITQNETVICYLYFDEEQRTSDTFRFKFKVKVSEIDKISRYEVKERFINNTVIVDRLDVVTKEELKEALKNVGGVATEGLLTEAKAEETYAKKSEAVDNTNFELVKNRVLALELKTDKDTVYDDSEVKERLTTLENKQPIDLSNYATKEELRTVSGSQPNVDNLVTKEELENKHYISDVSNLATKEELQEVRNSQPTVDTSNLVTRDELESKGYLTTHQDLSEYAKKSELYNDSDLKARVEVLEQKTDKDTVYDDTPLKERVTALESKAIEGGAYDDSDLRNRVVALETKHDNDTIYDDTEVKRRLTELEGKPALDTSVFVTEEKLNEKGYITDISGLATKQELANTVTKDELEAKHYVTEEELNNYALKSELPTPYNDSTLNERVTALESKAIEGGAYDDSDLRNRVVALEGKEDKDTKYDDTEVKRRLTEIESKPAIDTSVFVTDQKLAEKGYLTQHQSLENVVTKEELESKGYLTSHQDLSNYALKSEIPQPYNDGPLNERVTVLESRPTTGGSVDTSNLVTKDELASKNYLTEHQPLTEVNNRLDVLEAKQDKDTVYNDSELRERVTNLENKPNVDLTNYITSEQLENKHYLTQHQPLDNLVTKEELNNKGYVTDEVLNSKGYLTEHQNISHLVTKDELSGKGYITEETLNSKNYLTEDVLNTKNYLTQHQDLSALVTKQELENKHYLTEHQTLTHLATTSDLEVLRNISVNKAELSKKVDATEFNTFKYNVVTKSELAEKGYISDLSNYVTKQELHEATEIDYSNIVTTDELEGKHYVTANDITNLATKVELQDKVSKSDFDRLKNDAVRHEELASIHYLTEATASETYAKKSELPTPYNDSALVNRVSALESRPNDGQGLVNQLNNRPLKYWCGTQTQYDAITNKDIDTIYDILK